MGLRERLYNFFLTIGLFYIMPLIARLPDSIGRHLLKLRAFIRFSFCGYRSYVNRAGLKDIAIKNISETLFIERNVAKKKIFRLMLLEVLGERNGLLMDKYDLSDLKGQFTIRGLDILEGALKNGKGVIFASVHSDDTLLFMLFLSLLGYDIYGLFDGAIDRRIIKNPLHRFAILKDQKITGRIGKLYTGKGSRRLFEVLHKNGIIVWMVDVPVQNKKREEVVDFLGSKILVNRAFWQVAVRSGASIVPYISIYNHRMNRHEVYIAPPVDPSRDTIQGLFDFYEPYIRQYPESWLGWYYLDMLKE